MAREWTVNPGDNWVPNVQPGDVVTFEDGRHKGGKLSGAKSKDVTLQARNPAKAIITDSVELGGGEIPCALRVTDGGEGLTISGIHFTGSRGRGLRITDHPQLTLYD